MKQAVLDIVAKSRLVAIVRLDDLTNAVQIADALLEGGVVAQEVTLTNPDALSAMKKIQQEIADFRRLNACIGVGSVRSLEECKRSIESGAHFIVSPFFHPEVVEYCREHEVVCMPGVMTPTEMAQAWNTGAEVLKVFPARGLGPEYIRDVLAPMPYLKLMPTGGIDLNNMTSYFQQGAMAVGVGGNLLDKKAIHSKNWKRVTEVAGEYAALAGKRS